MHQVKPTVPECVTIESFTKSIPRTLQTSHIIAKDIGYSPQPDDKALFLKTILSYVIEHGEMEPVFN